MVTALVAYFAGDTSRDWLRHLLGLTCRQQVTGHEFTSGERIGQRPGRCVWLPSEQAPWCTRPRRCHAQAGSTGHETVLADTDGTEH